ncbi:terminase small subunit-like protein [Acetobacter vaccinii]|nr:terminase small subunit [Acetobacter vaccinii]
MKAGRPSVFSLAIEDEICTRLMEGESLRSICRDDHMPGQSTVFEWLESCAYADFRSRYAQARARAAEAFEDEIIDVARTATAEDAAAKRLHVDTLKWIMSKRAPKVYGDKITQEHTGPDGGPVQVSEVRRVIIRPPAKNE